MDVFFVISNTARKRGSNIHLAFLYSGHCHSVGFLCFLLAHLSIGECRRRSKELDLSLAFFFKSAANNYSALPCLPDRFERYAITHLPRHMGFTINASLYLYLWGGSAV